MDDTTNHATLHTAYETGVEDVLRARGERSIRVAHLLHQGFARRARRRVDAEAGQSRALDGAFCTHTQTAQRLAGGPARDLGFREGRERTLHERQWYAVGKRFTVVLGLTLVYGALGGIAHSGRIERSSATESACAQPDGSSHTCTHRSLRSNRTRKSATGHRAQTRTNHGGQTLKGLIGQACGAVPWGVLIRRVLVLQLQRALLIGVVVGSLTHAGRADKVGRRADAARGARQQAAPASAERRPEEPCSLLGGRRGVQRRLLVQHVLHAGERHVEGRDVAHELLPYWLSAGVGA